MDDASSSGGAAPAEGAAAGAETTSGGISTWLAVTLIAAGLAIVGGGAFALMSLGGEDPGPAPSPTPSASPSPSAEPTVDEFGRALPGLVTVDPSLPDALPLTEEVWGEMGPGWVLASYRPAVEEWDDEGEAFTESGTSKHVIYAVSPSGERYQALELPVDPRLEIQYWSPTTRTAYATSWGTSELWQLDLSTGAVGPVEGAPASTWPMMALGAYGSLWGGEDAGNIQALAVEKDGRFRSIETEGLAWVGVSEHSASGRWVLLLSTEDSPTNADEYLYTYHLLDASEGTIRPVSAPCPEPADPFVQWTDRETVIYWCEDFEAEQVVSDVLEVDPATGSVEVTTLPEWPEYGPGEPSVHHGLVLGPEWWAGEYYADGRARDDGTTPMLGLDRAGRLTPVPLKDEDGSMLRAVGPTAVVDRVVYSWGQSEPLNAIGARTIVAYDTRTGEATVLLPEPPGGATAGVAAREYRLLVHGVSSWSVAGSAAWTPMYAYRG